MRFRPVLITPPAELPVTDAEFKSHGVVDYADDDAVIDALMSAAVDRLDGFRGILGRAMVTQTWQYSERSWNNWLVPMDGGCRRGLIIQVPDVSAVVVKYDDESGTEQTLAAADFSFHPVAQGTEIVFASDFSAPVLEADNPAPVRVEFTCGFGAAADVPKALKVAIMQFVRQMYDDRGGAPVLEPNSIVNSLISGYRWTRI